MHFPNWWTVRVSALPDFSSPSPDYHCRLNTVTSLVLPGHFKCGEAWGTFRQLKLILQLASSTSGTFMQLRLTIRYWLLLHPLSQVSMTVPQSFSVIPYWNLHLGFSGTPRWTGIKSGVPGVDTIRSITVGRGYTFNCRIRICVPCPCIRDDKAIKVLSWTITWVALPDTLALSCLLSVNEQSRETPSLGC